MLQGKGKDEVNIERLQKEIAKYNKVCENCKQTYIELSYDYNKLNRELGNLQRHYGTCKMNKWCWLTCNK